MVGSRVYVGGLPFGVRERDLEKFFKGFGRTRDILIKNGYGFVEFEDYRDADDAVYELNGKELLGERVVVEPARGIERRRDHRDEHRSSARPSRHGDNVTPYNSDRRYGPPTRTEFRLIVENLSSRISWQDLKDFMRQAGEVTYADAHKQRKNEGVVEFATHADMRNALEKLDNTELNGRRIRLTEDRRGGGGRGGGGGGRRSRSRSSSSRSRSRSRRRSRSRSRSSRRSSRSRSRSNSKTRASKKAGSKSPVAKSRSRSKQRSASPASRSRSRSKSAASRPSPTRNSRERSRSGSKEKKKSVSRSPSPNERKETNGSDRNESIDD